MKHLLPARKMEIEEELRMKTIEKGRKSRGLRKRSGPGSWISNYFTRRGAD